VSIATSSIGGYKREGYLETWEAEGITFLSMSEPSFLNAILLVPSRKFVMFLLLKSAIKAFSKTGKGKSVSPMFSSLNEHEAKQNRFH
jgi:hypothetical protein